MIQLSPNRKNKIDLSDYSYTRDIQNRLLMATFTVADVDVLDEVLNNSLTIHIEDLLEDLEITEEELIPILDKLSTSGLLSYNEHQVLVDKEMRKYYESQICKFDERFKPGIDYFLGLLSKVPIHALPNWYSIPRTSNNIFESIIERNLLTPKTYQRYLIELNFDNPILTGIMHDVFDAPNLKISAEELREKYDLSKELFEEYLLHLEFSCVCCLSYERVNGSWKEVVTPFYEWEEHLRFLRDNQPSSLAEEELSPFRKWDFSYVRDVETLLRAASDAPLALNKQGELTEELLSKLIHKCRSLSLSLVEARPYFSTMVEKLIPLKLANQDEKSITPGRHASSWLEQPYDKKALFLYNHPKNLSLFMENFPGYTERQLREVEKNLAIVKDSKWVSLGSFIQRLLAPIGKTEPVTLKKVGKNWRYVRPQYTADDRNFIKATIFDWLASAGMVYTGSSEKGDCFCLTAFGRSILG